MAIGTYGTIRPADCSPEDVEILMNYTPSRDVTNDFVLIPPTATPQNDNEKRLIVVGDGTYAANIVMAAVEVGAAGNIRRGTKLVANFAQNNVLEIFAASDFTAGRDPSTNEEYLKKLATGLASKTVGGRKSYEASIRAQPKFANILHCSILGCGDAEQQRDQHGLLPISSGGKVDVYVQTNPGAQEIVHFIPARYVGPGELGTVWQFALDREAAPGFYEIAKISSISADNLMDDNTSHKILSEVREYNLNNSTYVPDIKYLYESSFTRYQTAQIRFEDEQRVPTVAMVMDTR